MIPGLTHDFEIASPLSRSAALAAMASHIEPIKWFRLQVRIGFWTVYGNYGTDKFEGEMTDDGFIAQRIMGYGNFCPPRSTGVITSAGRGSTVRVRMTPAPASSWLPVVVVLVLLVSLTEPRLAPDVRAIAMVALMFVIWVAAFWFEATRQEATMHKIFQAN